VVSVTFIVVVNCIIFAPNNKAINSKKIYRSSVNKNSSNYSSSSSP